MEYPPPTPAVSVRDVLPSLGFEPVWGTPTDEEPAYAFKRGGIDIIVAQGVSLYFQSQFKILGMAATTRALREIEQPMPLALASRNQIVAWLTFAVGADFSPSCPVGWFQEGLDLQDLLPWEVERLRRLAELEESARLHRLRPLCFVERRALRSLLNTAIRSVGMPPVAGRFEIAFADGILRLYARGRLHCASAEGADWPNRFCGEQVNLHALDRRLRNDPVEVGIEQGNLQIERVRIPVLPVLGAPHSPASTEPPSQVGQ